MSGEPIKHKNALAIYKGVSVRQVADFLEANRDKNFKLLTTPEGFSKIKEAMLAVEMIKKSGQMRTHIRRTFPVGTEVSVQEAKSMLKQVYKKMGLNTSRGITTKELEQYAEIEKGKNRMGRVIKILNHK